MKKSILFILSFFFIAQLCVAQEQVKTPRFWDDVQTIKKYDKLFKPLDSPILFIGSSSIRKWNTLNTAFGNYNVLNRGIGGAAVNDVTFYLNDLVFPYSPRQIVIYVGSNDLVNATATADTVFNRTVNLYKAIRSKLPDVPIAYISIQGVPSREAHLPRALQVNKLMKDFLAKELHTSFIDVYHPMLKDGKNRRELFVNDMLHMNREGYAIWEKVIEPYLVKPVN